MSLILLATSHRVAPGLLTWRAWEALRSAPRVLARDDHPLLPYLAEAGVRVERVTDPDPDALVDLARREAEGPSGSAGPGADVVFVAAQDGDERLMREIGRRVVDDPLDVEVLHGSYDLPGARLLDLVSVMDTLRRECPWDRKQTHESLVKYLLEEAYEVEDAVSGGDLAALREELGDVLMQVAFHSVVASERDDGTGFTIDDVAAGIVDKLVRRHPHVFADVTVRDADEVNANWEQIKAAERAEKKGEAASVLDGVPMGQPALSLAAQLQRRAARVELPEDAYEEFGSDLVGRLFSLVRQAQAEGVDAEAELRAAAREFAGRVRAWEREHPASGD
ncbi:MazG family protein [Actinomadura logoneensis]|uniref:MazG family protein n=1 Tax=Actinomadura logoneensis TaxID=2293572 RepID=A0A372JM38_9ACTN|nr:MazG family protein [Actinomadura logoneensis]RFU40388.1 MazG family protein [Actinomadura logoneensis]